MVLNKSSEYHSRWW